MAAVPSSVNDTRPGLSCMSARIRQTAFMNAAGSATRTPPVPRTAMALRFFEPMTAPTPLRPAARCLSFMMQAKRTSFSPPGPMHATRKPGNSQLPAQPVLGLPDQPAPVARRIAQLDAVVVDEEVDRPGRASFEDHHVVARELQLRTEVAARVRRGDGVGQRALGHHHVSRAAGNRRAGQRAGGEDQLVGGRQRVDPRVELFVEITRRQTATADIVALPIGPDVLDRDPPARQVDSQQLARVSRHRSLLPCCVARACASRGCSASCRRRRRSCDGPSRPRARTIAPPAAPRRRRSPAWDRRRRTPAVRRTGCTSRPCRSAAA